MKRKFLSATLLTVALGLSGCSSPASPVDNSAEIESLKAQVQELEKENQDLKKQLESTAESTTAEETETAETGIQISVGETISNDYMEITINKVELIYDVLPDDVSGLYTHYEADQGNVYLHIDTDVKNLGKQNLACDEILKATADYNSGYTYSSFAVPEDSNTGFTYANITSIKPLETLGVHYLFECPQEVEESSNPLFIIIEPSPSKDSYILTVR